MASDGNWNYHKLIKCNYRKIVKVLEDKTANKEEIHNTNNNKTEIYNTNNKQENTNNKEEIDNNKRIDSNKKNINDNNNKENINNNKEIDSNNREEINNNKINNKEEIDNNKINNKNKKYKKRKLLKDNNGNIIKDIKEKYYNNFNKDTINQNSSYDSCINNMNYINYNFIDCNIHIVDKAETSLVESFNSSLRSNISSLHRKTKSFNKSFKSLYNSILIWVNKDIFIQNKEKYANFGRIC